MNKIEVEHVSFTYLKGTPFEKKALDDVSLQIRSGIMTGIIGHTGSGKSTLMQMLNGLEKPDSGKVFLDGYDVHITPKEAIDAWISLPPYNEMRKSAAKKSIKAKVFENRKRLCFRVGLVMQYPEYQLFEDTVYNDIAYGPKNMGLSQEEIDSCVKEAAKFCEIGDELLGQSPFDLSGGQKRRVALAGVIAMKPEVLVLDEPAAGLDPRGRNFIFEGIKNYQKSTGSTVVIISHSMEDMAKYCDDVAVMANGKVLMSGSCEEVFSHVSQLNEIGLNIPQITRLMILLKEKGLPVSQDVYTVDAAIEELKKFFLKGVADI